MPTAASAPKPRTVASEMSYCQDRGIDDTEQPLTPALSPSEGESEPPRLVPRGTGSFRPRAAAGARLHRVALVRTAGDKVGDKGSHLKL